MSTFSIRSTSVKGSFEVVREDSTLLYEVKYKDWFSGEATANFDGNSYKIKSPNIWQSKFEIFRNGIYIGKFSFNWKGGIIISHTNRSGTKKEMLLQFKGFWNSRFILSDASDNELLAMVPSWSALKYVYSVNVTDGRLPEDELKELLMICGYGSNLYMTTMMAVF